MEKFKIGELVEVCVGFNNFIFVDIIFVLFIIMFTYVYYRNKQIINFRRKEHKKIMNLLKYLK